MCYVRHAHTQCLPISDATNASFESNYNLIDTNTFDMRLHTLVQQTQYIATVYTCMCVLAQRHAYGKSKSMRQLKKLLYLVSMLAHYYAL